MRVLVTNPSYRNTTAIVRALGREGIRVELLGAISKAGKRQDGQAFHSRYCRRRHYARDPRHDIEGFVDDLEDLLRREKYDVLLPVSTNTVIPVSRSAGRIRPLAPFPFPDYDKVELAHDKSKMIALAERLGVAVPRTVCLDGRAELNALLDGFEFPVVIKTRKGAASSGVFYASDRQGISDILERLEARPLSDPSAELVDSASPLMQEFIAGPIHDVCILAREGEVLAHTVQVRERTLPVNGGSGVINRTCEHEQIRDYAFRLVEGMKWNGIAMVEFKLDSAGRPRLMELNPKFWGTLDLSIQAGVNFPLLACLMVTGQEVLPSRYRRNLRYRWLVPDGVRTVKASPDKLAAAWDFFSPLRGGITSELRLRDLGPFRHALGQMLRGKFRTVGRLLRFLR